MWEREKKKKKTGGESGRKRGESAILCVVCVCVGGGSSNSCPVSMNVSKENDDHEGMWVQVWVCMCYSLHCYVIIKSVDKYGKDFF